jgi:branched-chain amino acid transport system substrate-binding protein
MFAEYIRSDLGLDRVAILYINNESGMGAKDSFKNKFEVSGGIVNSIESYEEKARDMKTQLLKISKENPQAIIVISYPFDTIIIVKQVKELGISLPLYFQTESPEDPSVIQGAGEAINDVIYILPAEPSGNVVAEFGRKFQEKFNKKPALYAAEGYDAFNLILDSVEICKKDFTHNCIKEQLYKIKNYQGASGIITFDKNGDVIKPMAIKKIVDGEKIILKIK